MTGQSSPEQAVAWPDVWSGSQVCAFSGLDGPTRWATAVGARTLASQFGLSFDTEPNVRLVLRAVVDGQLLDHLARDGQPATAGLRACHLSGHGVHARIALGRDLGELEVVLEFAAQNLVRGTITAHGTGSHEVAAVLELSAPAVSLAAADRLATDEQAVALSCRPKPEVRIARTGDVAALLGDPERFGALPAEYQGQPSACAGLYRFPLRAGQPVQLALAFGTAAETQAPALLENGDLGRLAPPPVAETPSLPPLLSRARAKALAILRTNVFAAEGNLPRRWMVPQRLKHRNFNTFHAPFLALAALQLDDELGADVLRCALAQQQPNGYIPDQAWPLGQSVDMAPPLLCWGCWQVYRATGDRQLLEDAVPRLKDYVKYPLAARLLERLGHARSAGAKFLTWGRGEGSNMDNSPRFDINEPFAAVDLTSYAVSEIELVARMIEELTPEHREAVHLGWMGEELGRETHEYFWDPEAEFFFDRYPDGDRVAARTVAGLIPLFAGVATEEQARAIVERHLADPDAFATPFAVPSLAADDPRFDGNMWRGATWPGMNLLLYCGLLRYGFIDQAEALRERTVEVVARCYEQTGSLWEFYDSTDQRAPSELPRGRRIGALADYGWTAAAFLILLDGLRGT